MEIDVYDEFRKLSVEAEEVSEQQKQNKNVEPLVISAKHSMQKCQRECNTIDQLSSRSLT